MHLSIWTPCCRLGGPSQSAKVLLSLVSLPFSLCHGSWQCHGSQWCWLDMIKMSTTFQLVPSRSFSHVVSQLRFPPFFSCCTYSGCFPAFRSHALRGSSRSSIASGRPLSTASSGCRLRGPVTQAPDSCRHSLLSSK